MAQFTILLTLFSALVFLSNDGLGVNGLPRPDLVDQVDVVEDSLFLHELDLFTSELLKRLNASENANLRVVNLTRSLPEEEDGEAVMGAGRLYYLDFVLIDEGSEIPCQIDLSNPSWTPVDSLRVEAGPECQVQELH